MWRASDITGHSAWIKIFHSLINLGDIILFFLVCNKHWWPVHLGLKAKRKLTTYGCRTLLDRVNYVDRTTHIPFLSSNLVSIKHCPVTLDLAFVMDASSDVGRSNFQLEKAFAKVVSSKFTITKHQSHIGLITYANLPSLRMRFRQYNSIFGKMIFKKTSVSVKQYGMF